MDAFATGSYVEDTYRYQHLEADTIRVLRILPGSTPNDIHCYIEHLPRYFTDDVHYTALSYCWGDQSKRKQITVDWRVVSITESLFDALSNIWQHHGHDFLIWVDAVCINQDDIPERNLQVSQMWRIYSGADTVLAWLGLEDESTTTAVAALQKIGQIMSAAPPKEETMRLMMFNFLMQHHDGLADTDKTALLSLLSRNYFRRTWIIQEFSRAQHMTMLCGRHEFSPQPLRYCNSTWLKMTIPAIVRLCEARQGFTLREAAAVGHPDVRHQRHQDILANFCVSQCSDPRDRIFAMLGHPTWTEVDPQRRFPVDYKLTAAGLAAVVLSFYDELLRRDIDCGYIGAPTQDEIYLHADVLFVLLSTALGIDMHQLWLEHCEQDWTKAYVAGTLETERHYVLRLWTSPRESKDNILLPYSRSGFRLRDKQPCMGEEVTNRPGITSMCQAYPRSETTQEASAPVELLVNANDIHKSSYGRCLANETDGQDTEVHLRWTDEISKMLADTARNAGIVESEVQEWVSNAKTNIEDRANAMHKKEKTEAGIQVPDDEPATTHAVARTEPNRETIMNAGFDVLAAKTLWRNKVKYPHLVYRNLRGGRYPGGDSLLFPAIARSTLLTRAEQGLKVTSYLDEYIVEESDDQKSYLVVRKDGRAVMTLTNWLLILAQSQ